MNAKNDYINYKGNQSIPRNLSWVSTDVDSELN